jgi:GxxExxY protein
VAEGLILIEIKVAPHIEPRHVAQALNYLRISNLEVGLILNFGPSGQFKRVVYANDRKRTAIPSSEVRQENK